MLKELKKKNLVLLFAVSFLWVTSASALQIHKANPHFAFDAQVLYDSVMYDPSYGLTGWAPITEFAHSCNGHSNNASFQSGTIRPCDNNNLTVHYVDWTCDHN